MYKKNRVGNNISLKLSHDFHKYSLNQSNYYMFMINLITPCNEKSINKKSRKMFHKKRENDIYKIKENYNSEQFYNKPRL